MLGGEFGAQGERFGFESGVFKIGGCERGDACLEGVELEGGLLAAGGGEVDAALEIGPGGRKETKHGGAGLDGCELLDLVMNLPGKDQVVFAFGAGFQLECSRDAEAVLKDAALDFGKGDAEIAAHGGRDVHTVGRCGGGFFVGGRFRRLRAVAGGERKDGG